MANEINELNEMDDVEVKDVPKMYWLPDHVYIALKWVTIIALPAVGTFYQALAGIYGLPLATEVCETCSLLALLLGSLIGVSSVAGKIRG